MSAALFHTGADEAVCVGDYMVMCMDIGDGGVCVCMHISRIVWYEIMCRYDNDGGCVQMCV